MLQQRLQYILVGLKSRSDEARAKYAQELLHFVTTELREATAEQCPQLMDDLIHGIFVLIQSSDANDKKGGILAIGKNSNLTSLSVWRNQWWHQDFSEKGALSNYYSPLPPLAPQLRKIPLCEVWYFLQICGQ